MSHCLFCNVTPDYRNVRETLTRSSRLPASAIRRGWDARELAELAREEVDVGVAQLPRDFLDWQIRRAEHVARRRNPALERERVQRRPRREAKPPAQRAQPHP